MERYEEVEHSLTSEFAEPLYSKFSKGVKQFQMIAPGDRIAVCISGGKDSMLLAKLMQQLQRHGRTPFTLEFLSMDPGYLPENRRKIEENAALLNIPLKMFDAPIFEAVNREEHTPCFLCARMRRGYLYRKAQELGCNKIALGHHFDDVIETTLMAMLYGGQIQTMMPKVLSKNCEGMELIRPMYFVREADIIAFQQRFGLEFLSCACRVAQNAKRENGEFASKRAEMKELIAHFRQINPRIESNIYLSTQNVDLEMLQGYHSAKGRYNFMDDYEERRKHRWERNTCETDQNMIK